jgi:hypothetical protein
MLPQWPWVVWASTLQFPSNDAAIADGVEQTVAEATTRAMAQLRLPIMGVLLLPALKAAEFDHWTARMNECDGRVDQPATRDTHALQHLADI